MLREAAVIIRVAQPFELAYGSTIVKRSMCGQTDGDMNELVDSLFDCRASSSVCKCCLSCSRTEIKVHLASRHDVEEDTKPRQRQAKADSC